MTKTYSALPHLNGNLLAAIDFETTGTIAGWHEPIQIAIQPLNSDLRPLDGVRPFYWDIAPEHIERADGRATGVHGKNLEELQLTAPAKDKIADMLIEWFDRLDLPFEKSLVPLAHNYEFEHGFGKAWLGDALYGKLFFGHARDAMRYALSLNDRAVFMGENPPFNSVSLKSLCNKFSVVNTNPHDALADCLAEAEVYRCLLHFDVF